MERVLLWSELQTECYMNAPFSSPLLSPCSSYKSSIHCCFSRPSVQGLLLMSPLALFYHSGRGEWSSGLFWTWGWRLIKQQGAFRLRAAEAEAEAGGSRTDAQWFRQSSRKEERGRVESAAAPPGNSSTLGDVHKDRGRRKKTEEEEEPLLSSFPLFTFSLFPTRLDPSFTSTRAEQRGIHRKEMAAL